MNRFTVLIISLIVSFNVFAARDMDSCVRGAFNGMQPQPYISLNELLPANQIYQATPTVKFGPFKKDVYVAVYKILIGTCVYENIASIDPELCHLISFEHLSHDGSCGSDE